MMKRTIGLFAAPLCLAVALVSFVPAGARNPAARAPCAQGSQADPTLGRQLFMRNCAMCHGENGEGKSGPRLAGNSLSLEAIQKKVTNGGTQMPSFGGKLSRTDVEAVSAYVRSLGAGS
jgi:mono/diheme cytochrome c family protein